MNKRKVVALIDILENMTDMGMSDNMVVVRNRIADEVFDELRRVSPPTVEFKGDNYSIINFPRGYDKVSAIKLARAVFGMSLKEGKEFVEANNLFSRDMDSDKYRGDSLLVNRIRADNNLSPLIVD